MPAPVRLGESTLMVRLSVILPTRNRASLLDSCLASLVHQALPDEFFEVLVVDNGSSDDTSGVVQRHADRLPLRYLSEPNAGLHAARHAGLREARSDILVFGDDDIMATPTWLASIDESFRDAGIAIVGGNNLPLFETSPPTWLMRWWNMSVGGRRAMPHLSVLDFGSGRFDIDPGLVWGCNFSIRRSALQLAGGFHPDAMPKNMLRWRGDGETSVSDAIRKAGLRAHFHSGASVSHFVSTARMSVEYFEQRSYAQGISDSYTDLRRHGGLPSSRAAMGRRLRSYASMVLAMLRSGGDAVGKTLRIVQWRCLKGYLEGYAYHQTEVSRDASLRAWVVKESYF